MSYLKLYSLIFSFISFLPIWSNSSYSEKFQKRNYKSGEKYFRFFLSGIDTEVEQRNLRFLKEQVAVYYISPTGNDSNDGLSPAKAFRTIQLAADKTLPGDTVVLMDGVYSYTDKLVLKQIMSGAPEQWITFKSMNPQKARIKVAGKIWSAIEIDANYIVLDGIELEGNVQSLKLSDAEAAEADAEKGGQNWSHYSQFNTGGISIGGNQSKGCHHVEVKNCVVHDFPGGGIGANRGDYITIERNIVFNTSWYTMYANSAISLWHLYNSDNVTGYKNFVCNNFVYNNRTQVKWVSCSCYSDGNGIIIDDNKNTQPGAISGPYTGRSLVANNVVFNNGGSGIHAYLCRYVDIINNTSYSNGAEPNVAYPEIYQNQCEDGMVVNNIMFAKTGGKVNMNYNNIRVKYDYNIYWNGSYDIKGPHDRIVDPLFLYPSVDPDWAVFKLKDSSPAVDFVFSAWDFPSDKLKTDYEGNIRPQGLSVDAGALESSFSHVGVEEVGFYNSDLKLFPMPVRDVLFISSQKEKVHKIELYSMQGKYLCGKCDDQKMELSHILPGTYLLRIYFGNHVECKLITIH